MAEWIDRRFPAAVGRYRPTNDPDVTYNCIAHAAGVTDTWWSDEVDYFWPAFRSPDVASLVSVFETLGYSVCDPLDDNPAFGRVAIYATDGRWTHAARSLPSGRWTSKLGSGEDIEHETVDCLCGGRYGSVARVLRRPW